MVKPTSEERVGPNLIIKRYTTQSDAGDRMVRMPCTEQGCQKQIKLSYWWVCLYRPIELCTLALGQVASENDISWTSRPSLPISDLWWVWTFPILGPPMNKHEGMDKQHPGPSCILAPCSRIGYKTFHASHNGRSCSFSFWVGWPGHSHIQLGTSHSVVGYYLALLFLALNRRWLWSDLRCRGVRLIPRRSTRYLFAIGGNRFGARNVGLVGCSRMSVVTRVRLVPRVQCVSFNGRHHGNDGHPKWVVKNDVVFKCSRCGDGTNQRLDV